MKLFTFLVTIGVFIMSSVCSSGFSQVVKLENSILITAKGKPVSVKKHLWEDFHASFKNTSQVQWFSTGKNYVANFMIDDQRHSAMFTLDGRLLHHLHFGFESMLEPRIKIMLRRCYPEHDITSAAALTVRKEVALFITLSNDKEVIEIRLDRGNIDELKRFGGTTPSNSKFREKNLVADR